MTVSVGILIALGMVEALWLVRLWRLGLIRVYPYLSICLGASAVLTLGGVTAYSTLGRMSVVYGWFWVVAQPVLWTLRSGVIAEAYNHMLRGYKGLQKLAKLGANVAMAAAGLIVLGMIFADAAGASYADPWRMFWFQQQKNAYLALTAACLLFAFIGVYCRLRISRNVLVIFSVFGFLFLAKATLLVFHNHLGDEFGDWKNFLGPTISIAAFAFGIAAVTEEEEEKAQNSIALSGPGLAQAAVAARQLAAANDSLLKVLRS